MNSVPLRLMTVPQGVAGLLLIGIFWPLNWTLPGLRTAYLFFPLWLGYILTIDALVFVRSGSSMLSRSRKNFVKLFFLSAPAWWLFEVINWRTQNWEYLGGGQFGPIQYFILASISFSTVMPAVFETGELLRSFNWMDRFGKGPRIEGSGRNLLLCLTAGSIMLALVLLWPRYFYPFVWGSIVLILEPVNAWLGRRTFFEALRQGNWRPVIALSGGALVCGFFWEMWNYFSYPKWVYHTPGAEFLYVFEMPLLGYIGYLPFAWELFALKNLCSPQAPEVRL